VLDRQDAAVAGSLDGLADVSGTLAQSREDVARAVQVLPSTLEQTRTGLADLDKTLALLDDTATAARPAVQQLGPLSEQLDPALVEARPVLADLRPLLHDAAPMVQHLTPAAASASAQGVLADVRGPVLDRVRGPILDTLGNTWRGSGPYKLSGGGVQGDHKMYEELGYMLSNIDRASQAHDGNGALLGFQVSGGPGSLAPFSFDDWLRQMFHLPIAGVEN